MKIVFIPTFCLGIVMQCAGINQVMTSDSKTDGLPIGTETNPLNAALLKAAEQGDEKAVKLLLQQGANVDAQNSKGWTP